MNEVVNEAYEIMSKAEEGFQNQYLPELEVGEECELNDVWDGESVVTGINDGCGVCEKGAEGSYSYQISDTGKDGTSHEPIWINYNFEVVEVKEDELDTVVKITGIELL